MSRSCARWTNCDQASSMTTLGCFLHLGRSSLDCIGRLQCLHCTVRVRMGLLPGTLSSVIARSCQNGRLGRIKERKTRRFRVQAPNVRSCRTVCEGSLPASVSRAHGPLMPHPVRAPLVCPGGFVSDRGRPWWTGYWEEGGVQVSMRPSRMAGGTAWPSALAQSRRSETKSTAPRKTWAAATNSTRVRPSVR